jgi:hypothetical protein
MEEDKSRNSNLFKWLRHFNFKDKYRLGIYNDTTFEQIFHVRLRGRGVFITLVLSIVILIFGTTILIAFTPLREFIPGYPDSDTRREILSNAMKVDSLERELSNWSSYFDNVTRVVSGENPQTKEAKLDSSYRNRRFEDSRTINDSLLRIEVEKEEQFNLSINNDDKRIKDIAGLYFFPPLKGVISSHFETKANHFGIDVVAEPNAFVASTLDGTVIMANWTIETGHIIQIQHQDNIISIYKHNAKLLRQVGDLVKAGDVIAIVGNSGELTTGPHLHFELWYKGVPVDPELYIIF